MGMMPELSSWSTPREGLTDTWASQDLNRLFGLLEYRSDGRDGMPTHPHTTHVASSGWRYRRLRCCTPRWATALPLCSTTSARPSEGLHMAAESSFLPLFPVKLTAMSLGTEPGPLHHDRAGGSRASDPEALALSSAAPPKPCLPLGLGMQRPHPMRSAAHRVARSPSLEASSVSALTSSSSASSKSSRFWPRRKMLALKSACRGNCNAILKRIASVCTSGKGSLSTRIGRRRTSTVHADLQSTVLRVRRHGRTSTCQRQVVKRIN